MGCWNTRTTHTGMRLRFVVFGSTASGAELWMTELNRKLPVSRQHDGRRCQARQIDYDIIRESELLDGSVSKEVRYTHRRALTNHLHQSALLVMPLPDTNDPSSSIR